MAEKIVAWHKQEVDAKGTLITSGRCKICRCFPCEHVLTTGINMSWRDELCRKR